MADDLSGAALYAALAEHIYRRDENQDQTIALGDIKGVTLFDMTDRLQEFGGHNT